ncbi:hypothetical protein NF212_00240 [Parasalinivibrio latis]|uniref:hypothetical protein n=1 Tax=Parasalinivibrio latis TaxID=2952610 RepID=UPI0030E57465
MRHGWLAITALLCSFFASPVWPVQITDEQITQVTESQSFNQTVSEIRQALDNDETDKVWQLINSQRPLNREAAMQETVLHLRNLAQMTPKKEILLLELSRIQPAFSVRFMGDGYWITAPAFDFANRARIVLNRWQYTKLRKEIDILVQYDELKLSSWLKYTTPDYKMRREVVLGALPDLSKAQLDNLVAQCLKDKALLWLPDNAVMARLAVLTRDEALYDLLWRRRADSYSLAALNDLATYSRERWALEQMMKSTVNPSLRTNAYQLMASIKPLPVPVQTFLASRINDKKHGLQVAEIVADHGNAGWLASILDSGSPVQRKHVNRVLSE